MSARAAHGERKKQALEAIRRFEKNKAIWGSRELAAELEMSQAQAHQLIQSLFVDGLLTRASRTVVIPEAFVTAA